MIMDTLTPILFSTIAAIVAVNTFDSMNPVLLRADLRGKDIWLIHQLLIIHFLPIRHRPGPSRLAIVKVAVAVPVNRWWTCLLADGVGSIPVTVPAESNLDSKDRHD